MVGRKAKLDQAEQRRHIKMVFHVADGYVEQKEKSFFCYTLFARNGHGHRMGHQE